jgi:hypothetical protein
MRPSLFVLASLITACAGSAARPDDRLDELYTGIVTGLVTLPPSVAGQPVCSSLEVYATSEDSGGNAPVRIGRPAVHQGAGHCSYEIQNLPSGTMLAIHIGGPASALCDAGSSLTFAPEGAVTFTLA